MKIANIRKLSIDKAVKRLSKELISFRIMPDWVIFHQVTIPTTIFGTLAAIKINIWCKTSIISLKILHRMQWIPVVNTNMILTYHKTIIIGFKLTLVTQSEATLIVSPDIMLIWAKKVAEIKVNINTDILIYF